MARILYHADRISPHRAKTREGFFIAMGVPLSRTGYQVYKAAELQPSGVPDIDRLPPDASVQIYRDAEDVFRPASVASFEGKSVTYTHPPGGYLTPENDREYARGHVQNVRGPEQLPDGYLAMVGDVWIKDKQLITYVDPNWDTREPGEYDAPAGQAIADEISCGYTYRLEPMPDGDGYRMRDIVGNHVAIVPTGRAGPMIRVLDASPEENGGNKVMEGLKEIGAFFKDLGLRLVPAVATDAESERVAEQKKKDEEALKLRQRTMDADAEAGKEEMNEENLKKVTDAVGASVSAGLVGPMKTITDSLALGVKALKDAAEELSKSMAKKNEEEENETAVDGVKCNCDDAEGEMKEEKGSHHGAECPMFMKKGGDADLIPTETLPKKDVPDNPIPGADALAVVQGLRAIRPLIADSGDKVAIKAFNRAMDAAKRRKPVSDADYALLLDAASKPNADARAAAERSNVHRVGADGGGDKPNPLAPGSYEAMMRKFHRIDSVEAAKLLKQ